ncbi:hypothetical protein FRB95_002224 [Tulasnella sp. JGI-2019a]|nr:hypothetical protein FRB95_002224 [Tulasnella sp. JGI-2019a]
MERRIQASNDNGLAPADIPPLSLTDSHLISIPEHHRPVGHGGYCDLYQGIYLPNKQLVALKRARFPIHDPTEVANTKRRFAREGQIWAKLDHVNILRFLGMVNIEGDNYLVSRWYDLGDLSWFVSDRLCFLLLPEHQRSGHIKRGSFERFDEHKIVLGIASGLEYLHANRIVHGDLRAANVLLNADVQPLLCDFGMTKISDGDTSTGMKGAGSLRWMSPELENDGPRTNSTDMYAFGMTIVEILTGKLPYSNINNSFGVARAVFSGERPSKTPLTREGKDFTDLWDYAACCWDADPGRRPSAANIVRTMRYQGTSIRPTTQTEISTYDQIIAKNWKVSVRTVLLIQKLHTFYDDAAAIYAIAEIPSSVTWGTTRNQSYIAQALTDKPILVYMVGRIRPEHFPFLLDPLVPQDLKALDSILGHHSKPYKNKTRHYIRFTISVSGGYLGADNNGHFDNCYDARAGHQAHDNVRKIPLSAFRVGHIVLAEARIVKWSGRAELGLEAICLLHHGVPTA